MTDKNDLPIITDENEKEYLIEYQKTKSPKIKEALIIKYKPLVEYVVNRMNISIKNIDIICRDFVGYGYNGLIDAIERYNPNKGIKFKSYALWRIHGSIIDGYQIASVSRSTRQIDEASILKAVEKLSEEERQAIKLYYYKKLELEEIGIKMKISKEMVGQIINKAIENLRKMFNENNENEDK